MNEMKPILKAGLRSRGITVIRDHIAHAIPTLNGKGARNDADAIRVLLNGGCAFDGRGTGMISAPTIAALPPGLYRTVDMIPSKPQWRPIGPH